MNITLQFTLSHQTLDVAEQEVQAAINAASSYLPRTYPTHLYNKVNPADTPILDFGINFVDLAVTGSRRFCRYPFSNKKSLNFRELAC